MAARPLLLGLLTILLPATGCRKSEVTAYTIPKEQDSDPHGSALLCERFGIDPKHTLLADDMVKNLAPAKTLGMTTVWVDNGSEQAGRDYDEAVVDVRVSDIGEWLESILEMKNDQ